MQVPSSTQILAVVLTAVFAVVLGASPASAHTGFEASNPASGDVIDQPVDEIVVTFSGEAAAGLAGVALSVIVLDSISEIWTTTWGRLLLLKVVLVAAAVVGGAYNHRNVVPALDRDPAHQPTIDRLRSVVTFEAAALIAVTIATSFLIAASST